MTEPPAASPWGAAPRAAKPARTRSLACPNCGAPVAIRAAGISVTAACMSCAAVLDVANEDVRLIAAAQERLRPPLIEIGARGTLAGTEWEVVGYQVRSSEGGSWEWQEHLLFNPYRGFRFLLQDHGHWTLACLLRQDVPDPSHLPGEPRHYRASMTGQARTDYVLGEFYWRVKVGDAVAVAEFVDPPYILAQERDENEVTWSRGVYLDPALVQAAFKLGAMPPVVGQMDHQPSPYRVGLGRLWRYAAAAVLLLVLAHAAPFGRHRSAVLHQQTFHATAADRGHALASPVFDVPDPGGTLRIEARSEVANNWVQLGLSLVGQENSRTFPATSMIEAYSGYDEEYWTEGGPASSVTFGSVPGGAYRLLLTPDAGVFQRSLTTKTLPGPAPGSSLALAMAQAQAQASFACASVASGKEPSASDAAKCRAATAAAGAAASSSSSAPAAPGPAIDIAITVRRHPPAWANFWIALLLVLALPIAVTARHWWRIVWKT